MGLFDKFKKKKDEEILEAPQETAVTEEPVQEAQQEPPTKAEPAAEQAASAKVPVETPEEAPEKAPESAEEAPAEAKPATVLGFALLNSAEFDFVTLAEQFKADWDENLTPGLDKSGRMTSVFVGNVRLECTLMSGAIKDFENDENVEQNLISAEDKAAVKAHRAVVVVNNLPLAEKVHHEKLDLCIAFNKLCSSIMALPNAIAMCMGGVGLIIMAQPYRRFIPVMKSAQEHQEKFLPVALWVRPMLFVNEKGNMARTIGMEDFGRRDICLYATPRTPPQALELLMNLVYGCLQGGLMLKNQDMIKLDETQRAIVKEENNILFLIEFEEQK